MLLRRGAPLALAALITSCASRGPASTEPVGGVRLVAAYRTAVSCVDSVASLAGFDRTTMAVATRRTKTWTLTVRRPALQRDGAEAHVVRFEYGIVPGRDSVRLVRATAESFRFAMGETDAAKDVAPRVGIQQVITKLPVPGTPARAAIERISRACALLRIEEPKPGLPLRHRRIGG